MARLQDINGLLDELGVLLLPQGIVGLRLDYMVTDSQRSRRIVQLERHGASPRYAFLSARPHLRPQGVKAIVNNMRVDADGANQILDLVHQLSDLNDVGAWPLATTDRESVVVTPAGIEGTPFTNHPGFGRRYDHLCRRFKGVSRIVFSANMGETKKGSSRKVWMSFRDDDGNEMAAIAVNALAKMLRDWYGPEDAAHAQADANLGRWAHQLGMALDDFMDAALDLLTFDSLQQVTEIQLEERQ